MMMRPDAASGVVDVRIDPDRLMQAIRDRALARSIDV
jgi:hypothetical protein